MEFQSIQVIVKENCPYCERLEIYAHLLKIEKHLVFINYNEKNIKSYPALILNDGSYLCESIDIMNYIKSRTTPDQTLYSAPESWEALIELWCTAKENFSDITRACRDLKEFFKNQDINFFYISLLVPHFYRFKYTKQISLVYQALVDTGLADFFNKYWHRIQENIALDEYITKRDIFLKLQVLDPVISKEEFRSFDVLTSRCYLDTAATGLPLRRPLLAREQILDKYASSHSQTSDYSINILRLIQKSRLSILDFFDLDAEKYSVLFLGSGATHCANYVAFLLSSINKNRNVAISLFEHHSSDLPFRRFNSLFRFPERLSKGSSYLEDLKQLADEGKIDTIISTSCSNVNGHRPNLEALSQIALNANAEFIIDISQSAAHHNLYLSRLPRLDAFYFSGHKSYAPGSPGVLVIKTELLAKAPPNVLGGGAVNDVSLTGFEWTDDIVRNHQPGTQDALGIAQIADALLFLKEIGMHKIERHEAMLTEYALALLKEIKEITIYEDYMSSCGILAFNVNGIPHEKAAKLLFDRYGIEIRNACFCAHPYVRDLLRVSSIKQFMSNEIEPLNGMLRVSFGPYNKGEDVDKLVAALKKISLEEKANNI